MFEVEPAAAVPAQVGEAAAGVDESASTAAVAMLELGPEALIVAGASAVVQSTAAEVSLPEQQPASPTPPVPLPEAEPQVAAALSATRDAGPRPEQLRRESVSALLDEYPAGAMQWESRETHSVESAYEVDVAAFSSPLAFEHHLLRDDSD